jgi:hypothetical protein
VLEKFKLMVHFLEIVDHWLLHIYCGPVVEVYISYDCETVGNDCQFAGFTRALIIDSRRFDKT